MSSPLGNTFSEGSPNDFKQEFPREADALPGGTKSQVLDKWYAWASHGPGISVFWYLISECTSVINDEHVIYFKVSTMLIGIQQIFVGHYKTGSGLRVLQKLYISSETIMNFTCKYLQNIIRTTWERELILKTFLLERKPNSLLGAGSLIVFPFPLK